MKTMSCVLLTALLAAPLAGTANAETFKRFDKVEAETDLGRPWRTCYVSAALKGAYDLECDDFVHYIVYDTRVRKPGMEPVATTAATPVTEGSWKTGDLVLVSPTTVQSSWRLCSYHRPVQGGHDVVCSNRQHTIISGNDDWIRADPDFPAAAAPAEEPQP